MNQVVPVVQLLFINLIQCSTNKMFDVISLSFESTIYIYITIYVCVVTVNTEAGNCSELAYCLFWGTKNKNL